MPKSRHDLALIFTIVVLLALQFPVSAQISSGPDHSQAVGKDALTVAGHLTKSEPVIAQASTASEIVDVAAAGAVAGKKQKGELLITDSLWGNLILDLAYQRDGQLKKLAKRLNLVNWGTTAAVTGIAGGTLAQGIISLSTLNPPAGQSDSYLPGALGIGFAGLTLVTFTGRTVINQILLKRLRNRQLEIKHQVESILSRFEAEHGDNANAQSELSQLIGQRAANEWVQLWRSSNTVASLKTPTISVSPTALLLSSHH